MEKREGKNTIKTEFEIVTGEGGISHPGLFCSFFQNQVDPHPKLVGGGSSCPHMCNTVMLEDDSSSKRRYKHFVYNTAVGPFVSVTYAIQSTTKARLYPFYLRYVACQVPLKKNTDSLELVMSPPNTPKQLYRTKQFLEKHTGQKFILYFRASFKMNL